MKAKEYPVTDFVRRLMTGGTPAVEVVRELLAIAVIICSHAGVDKETLIGVTSDMFDKTAANRRKRTKARHSTRRRKITC